MPVACTCLYVDFRELYHLARIIPVTNGPLQRSFRDFQFVVLRKELELAPVCLSSRAGGYILSITCNCLSIQCEVPKLCILTSANSASSDYSSYMIRIGSEQKR